MPSPNPENNEARLPAPSCPACGYTLRELQHTGRLGCTCCYRMFAPIIAPQLDRLHHGTRHVGKTPLRAQLAQAVSAEDYEQAARLRDQLNLRRARWLRPAP